LAKRYGINQKNGRQVEKAYLRRRFADRPKRTEVPVLTEEEETVIFCLQRHTLLPLDDCSVLPTDDPQLTRCLCIAAYSVTLSPDCPRSRVTSRARRKFKRYPIGYFHIDIAEVQPPRAALLFVAIDRLEVRPYMKLHEQGRQNAAAAFLAQPDRHRSL